jgi:hypothetical protein
VPLALPLRAKRWTSGDKVHGDLGGVGVHPDRPDLRFYFDQGLPVQGTDDSTRDTNVFWVEVPAGGVLTQHPNWYQSNWTDMTLDVNVWKLGEKMISLYDNKIITLTSGGQAFCVIAEKSNTVAPERYPPGYYAIEIIPTSIKNSGAQVTNPIYAYLQFYDRMLPQTSVAPAPVVPLRVWCHRMMTAFDRQINSWSAITMIGSSMKLSQRSAMLTMQGAINQVQAMPNESWLTYVNMGFDKIGELNQADASRSVNNGAFASIRLYDMKAFQLVKNWLHDGQTLRTLEFNLLPAEGFTVTYADCSQQTSPTMVWTARDSFNFVTEDQSFELVEPIVELSEIEKALMMAKKIAQFDSNDFHLGDIFKKLYGYGKKAAGFIKDNAGVIAKGVEYAGKLA